MESINKYQYSEVLILGRTAQLYPTYEVCSYLPLVFFKEQVISLPKCSIYKITTNINLNL